MVPYTEVYQYLQIIVKAFFAIVTIVLNNSELEGNLEANVKVMYKVFLCIKLIRSSV